MLSLSYSWKVETLLLFYYEAPSVHIVKIAKSDQALKKGLMLDFSKENEFAGLSLSILPNSAEKKA